MILSTLVLGNTVYGEADPQLQIISRLGTQKFVLGSCIVDFLNLLQLSQPSHNWDLKAAVMDLLQGPTSSSSGRADGTRLVTPQEFSDDAGFNSLSLNPTVLTTARAPEWETL